MAGLNDLLRMRQIPADKSVDKGLLRFARHNLRETFVHHLHLLVVGKNLTPWILMEKLSFRQRRG
jgi:hypothetical protein